MKKTYLLILMMLIAHITLAQEVYIGFGPNYTSYNYTNSQGESNDDIIGENGIHFEGGYLKNTSMTNLKMAFALTFDQFDATGGNELNSYSWKTNFLGLQGGVRYGLIEAERGTDFSLLTNAGITIKKLLDGTQKIDGQTFDLNREPEFNGLFKGLYFGVEAKYIITNQTAIGLGYTYSLNYGATNLDETLHINSGAVVLKLFTSFY